MGFAPELYLIAVPAVLFAGMSKGGFGSGAAFAAVPMLALVVEPGVALGLMLPLLMLMDFGALKPYWGKWDRAEAMALILGSLPGLILAGLFWRWANPDLFRFLIGAIALLFVFWQLGKQMQILPMPKRALPRWAGWPIGAIVGFTSFISHAGGPAAAVYLLSKGMGKTTYQATTVLVFWIVNLLKFIPYIWLGIFSRETLIADLIFAPLALLGVWLGVIGHRALSEKAFFGITYIFLVAAGAKLIWDALT